MSENNQSIQIKEKLNDRDIKIEINGKFIVLKRFTIKDVFFVKSILTEEISSFNFTCKLIYNQLIHPKISFEEFENWDKSIINEIAIKFVENNRLLNKVFADESSDFYTNFKIAIDKYLNVSFNSLSNSLKLISSIKSVYPSNIPKIAQITPMVPNFLDNIVKLNTITQKMYFGSDFTNPMSSILNTFSYQRSAFQNLYKPMVDFSNKWISKNSTILTPFNKQFSSLQKKIDLPLLKDILNEYQWFITPTLLDDFVFNLMDIGTQDGNQRTTINDHYYTHFSDNNFSKIDLMFSRWLSTGLIKYKREKIIQHCIDLLKSDSLSNPSYLIVPTLIPQIEGIQTEFMVANGLKQLSENKWQDENGQDVFRKEFFDMQCDGIISLESAKDIFFNVLFETVYHGKAISYPITFNRHKIAHGEHINYGTKYNIIRAFLTIDFLMWLYDDNNE